MTHLQNGRLRLMTYLIPGLPLGLYQTYQHYLEETLGCPSYLLVEGRWSGPPADRMDPFTQNDTDIAFVCSTSYLRQIEASNEFMELLPVAPIHDHPKSNLQPVYFSEMVMRKDKAQHINSFLDLKGLEWAYNDEESLSGNMSVLVELKKRGLNTTFFKKIVHSGSHHNSIQLIKEGTVDVAAIDSNCFVAWLNDHPDDRSLLHSVCSLGPHPVQPIVVNSRLPDATRQKICEAFLNMNTIPEWKKKLSDYSVWGFKSINRSLYEGEKEIVAVVKDKNKSFAHY